MNTDNSKNEIWDIKIRSGTNNFFGLFKGLNQYSDLVFLFVKRDFVSYYKQTILGPIWLILQPLLTTITFYLIFGKFAKIELGTENRFLFFFSGIIIWNFFNDVTLKIADSFVTNLGIYSKVYFPRLVIPISILISGFYKFCIQMLIYVLVVFYHVYTGMVDFNIKVLLIIPSIILAGLYAFSIGLLMASLTIKYKDLKFLIQFGMQLLMFFSPVIYSTKGLSEKIVFLLNLNPMTIVINWFRSGLFNEPFQSNQVFILVPLLLLGFFTISLYAFSKIERKFVDTL